MFKIYISSYQRKRLVEKFSLQNAKKIADKLVDFDNVDAETMIHGNHITSDGKSGGWKNVINTHNIQVMNSVKPYLREFGYED